MLAYTTLDTALHSGKPPWSSEEQPLHDAAVITARNWAHGDRVLVRLYKKKFLSGEFTTTQIWGPVTSYPEALPALGSGSMRANTPWSGHYRVDPTM